MISRGKLWLALLAVLVVCLVRADGAQRGAQRSPRRAPALIGNIEGAVDDSSCGCNFRFPSDRNARRYVFFEDFSADAPVMNVGGHDVKLALARTTEPDAGVRRKGDRFSRWYTSGKLKVRMDFVATSVCAADDEQCEGNSYNVTISAREGDRRQTLRVVGGCGC